MSQSGGSVGRGCILVVFLGAVLAIVAAAALFTLSGRSSDDGAQQGVVGAQPAPRPVGAAPTPAAVAKGGAAVERIRQRGVLFVAMDTGEPAMSGTPPMFFLDGSGGRDGFDYVLSRRIADAVGARDVELVHAKYSGLTDLLVGGEQVDLIISGYSPDDTAGVAWSQPYLEYGLCLVVPSDSKVATTNDLFGKRIGIFDDDAAAEDAQRLIKGYTELVRMEDDYWQALLDGRFDGFLYDYPYTVAELKQFFAEHPDKAGKLRIAQYNLTDSVYAVGVRSADADLLAAVNAAIGAWRETDDYAGAIKRYLKGGLPTAITDTKARRVTVKKGDSLSLIAQRELGATSRWTELWELNRDRFPNPHLIEVGDEVRLP